MSLSGRVKLVLFLLAIRLGKDIRRGSEVFVSQYQPALEAPFNMILEAAIADLIEIPNRN